MKFTIGIPIYDGVDPLDVTAPLEVFNNLNGVWPDHEVVVRLLARNMNPVKTRFGMRIKPDRRFDRVKRLDLLWVPGGALPQLHHLMYDKDLHAVLCAWAERAKYVTSVCEGALILAGAGLLDGCRATTHWAFLPCLRAFEAIEVVGGNGDFPRWVIDDRVKSRAVRVTGAGISAGLDEAMKIVELLAGREIAEKVQVSIQYFPAPPVLGTIVESGVCPPPIGTA